MHDRHEFYAFKNGSLPYVANRSSHSCRPATLVDVTPGTVYAVATRNRRMNLLIVSQ